MSPTQEEALGDESSVGDKYPGPTVSITCRHCNRPFATMSIEKGLIPSINYEVPCASCHPFLALYETLQAKESEHTALLDRGPKHNGRREAHSGYRDARVALENFLITVEAPDETPDEAPLGDTQADVAGIDPMQHENVHEHAQTQQGPDDGLELRGMPSAYSSVTPKRKSRHETDRSGVERKRIRFTEAIEEPPQYRSSLEYCRGTKEYIPGRYVAAEGAEYWDTSGSTVSFAKFTGQKKMGSRFVDIVPREELPVDQDANLDPTSKGQVNGKNVRDENHLTKSEQTQSRTNRQKLRAHGQPRSTTPTATRPQRKVAQYDGSSDNSMRSRPCKPPLNDILKLSRAADTTSEKGGNRRPTPLDDRDGCHGSSDLVEASREPAKDASNIQHESVCPNEDFLTSSYKDMALAAMQGFDNLFKPSPTLDRSRPGAAGESEDAQVRDICPVPTFDMVDGEIPNRDLCSLAVPEQDEVGLQPPQAAIVIDGMPYTDTEVASKSTVRHEKPEQDGEDASNPPALEGSKDDLTTEVCLSTPSVTRPEGKMPERPEGVGSRSKVQLPELGSLQVSTNVAIASRQFARSLERPRCDLDVEHLPSAPSAASSPAEDELSRMGDGNTPSSAHAVKDLEDALSQGPPEPLLTVLSRADRENNRTTDLDYGNKGSNQIFTISRHDNCGSIARPASARSKNALRAPPLACDSPGAAAEGAGLGKAAEHDHRICPDEPTLVASLKKPQCIEKTKSANQVSDELISVRHHKHGLPARSAQNAPDADLPFTGISQRLALAHAWPDEITGPLKDRHGAAQEPQVHPDKAHDPAEEVAPCDQDLIEHRDEDTTTSSEGHVRDATEQSCNEHRPDQLNEGDEPKVDDLVVRSLVR